MERMLRKKKDNSDYEIDRELTGKFAIEKNAEYQEKIEQLEEENKKLKDKLSKREQGEYRYFGNDGEQDIYEITSIKDGPITYRKDSTGKWVADGEPPYVLC